jgi:hypothetical protein
MLEGVPRRTLVFLVLLYAGVALVLGVVFMTAVLLDQRVMDLLRDPVGVLNGSFTTGVLSNFGVCIWSWSGAVLAFVGAVFLRTGRQAGPPLLALGLLTIVIGLDDLFLGHEALDQKLGMPEPATFSVYVVALIAIGVIYRNFWLRTELLLAGLALTLFGAAALVDVIVSWNYSVAIVEDSVKFAGIATWGAFALSTTYLELVSALRVPAPV